MASPDAAAVNEFRAAWSWSIAHGHTELALRIATALRTFWAFSNQHPEAHRWLTDALAADPGHAPATVRAAALWARSMLPSVSLDQAEQDAADALAIYARAGDRAGMALCLAATSSFHAHRGDHTTAASIAAQAVDLAESAGDASAMTWAYWFRVDNARLRQRTIPPPGGAHPRPPDRRRLARPHLLQRTAFIAISEGTTTKHGCCTPRRCRRRDGAGRPVRRRHPRRRGDRLPPRRRRGRRRPAAAAQLILARRRRVTWITYGLLVTAALAARRDLTDDAAALYGRAERLLDARARYLSERQCSGTSPSATSRACATAQPLRWSLGMERGRSMAFDALIDLALDVCDPALAH